EYLEDVTCTSASDCWAVGFYYNNTTAQTLIEHWNGTNWAFVTSANTSVIQSNQLFGVTCVSASDCWAVGNYENDTPSQGGPFQTLIEHWDGTAWAIVASPNTNVTITHS